MRIGSPKGREQTGKVPAQRCLRPFDRESEPPLLQASMTFIPQKVMAPAADARANDGQWPAGGAWEGRFWPTARKYELETVVGRLRDVAVK